MRRAALLALAVLLASCVASSGRGTPSTRRPGKPDDPILQLQRGPATPEPTGLFALEHELAFNVLDGATVDSESGTVTLFGHWDPRFAGPRIPWLQHLAAFLDHPEPEFSLEWTAESERRVDHFLDTAESREQLDRVSDQWGDIVGPNGTVSEAGRLLLPGMGVSATESGELPGYSGLRLADRNFEVVITGVTPGSPAARAGVPAGGILTWLGNRQTLDAQHTLHELRFGGAGRTVDIQVRSPREERVYTFVLGTASGDPWLGMSSNDMAACIFRAAGKREAAGATYWTNVVDRLQNAGSPHYVPAFTRFLDAIGIGPTWRELEKRIQAGSLSQEQGVLDLYRAITRALDRAFDIHDGAASATFERQYSRTGAGEASFSAALEVVEVRRKEALGAALQMLWSRPSGVQIAPELIEATYGIRPEVEPVYINMDGTSQLARVMFEADYLGKRLIHSPSLSRRVPGYMTLFEFERRFPERFRNEGPSSEHHMWISVTRVEAAQSMDGLTLETRGARMQFNIRQKDGRGGDLPPEPGGYEELLTSLYEPLSAEFPALHELRECAKIGAVARWLSARHPTARLPRTGRSTWNGPKSLPGLVFMYLYPPTGTSRADTTTVATGGVSMVVPLQPFPPDAGVVDLSDSSLVVTPQAYNNTSLSRILGKKIEVPEWRPEGWVAQGKKGERTLEAVTVALNAGDSSAASIELRSKLESVARLSRQLEQTEKCIHLLTAKNVDRQASLRLLSEDLQEANDAFIRHSLDIVTAGLWDMKEQTGYRHLDALTTEAREAKERIESYQSRAELAKKLWQDASAGTLEQREEAARHVASLIKDLVGEAGPRAMGPLRKYLVPAKRLIKSIAALEGAAGIAGNLTTLYRAGGRVEKLGAEIDKEGAALRDQLLPLQRSLSDQIDEYRQDPEVRRLTTPK